MRQETLNEQKRVNTEEVPLDNFIVDETLAAHLTPKSDNRKRIFTAAELKNIQSRKRVAKIRF